LQRRSEQLSSAQRLPNILESALADRIDMSLNSWEDAYKTTPPWDVGRPQPALVELVRAGELNTGSALDVGCGTGENALYLAGNGFSVTGVDLTSLAIAAARAKAKERKLNVDFRIGNALSLDFKDGIFNNIIDSGLFHTFPDNERLVYAREMARVLAPRGKYFMLCFSDKEPTNWGGPRRVTKEEIESTFSPLFTINYIRDALFATRFHNNGGRAYLTSATRIAP
jgi:SAM-dependent methyltransferase